MSVGKEYRKLLKEESKVQQHQAAIERKLFKEASTEVIKFLKTNKQGIRTIQAGLRNLVQLRKTGYLKAPFLYLMFLRLVRTSHDTVTFEFKYRANEKSPVHYFKLEDSSIFNLKPIKMRLRKDYVGDFGKVGLTMTAELGKSLVITYENNQIGRSSLRIQGRELLGEFFGSDLNAITKKNKAEIHMALADCHKNSKYMSSNESWE